jgi:hypothetical protein
MVKRRQKIITKNITKLLVRNKKACIFAAAKNGNVFRITFIKSLGNLE